MIDFEKYKINGEERFFLGIDQSITNTGLVLFDKVLNQPIFSTTISTEKRIYLGEEIVNSIESRLIFIIDSIEKIIKELNVHVICIEGLAFNNKTNAARQLSGLFFGLILMFKRNNIKYFIVAPKSLKAKATNNGNSKKEQMLEHINENDKYILMKLNHVKKINEKFFDIVDAYHLSKYMID